MKKIIITGASGLLGRAVLRQFRNRKEYEVYALTTDAKHLEQYPYVHCIICDLTREEQRQRLMEKIRPDILLHLAWNQENDAFRMSSSNLLWLNISNSLLYLFEKYGGSRFLFAGSSSEYDGTEGLFDENIDVIPTSLYGLCKKNFNVFAKEYCQQTNIEYVGMRFFTIYGEEDGHSFGAIPSALRLLYEGKKLVCNSPDTTRDYIYADDAASVVIQLIKCKLERCIIVNVASGKAHTMREVFECIGEAMNKLELVSMNDTREVGKRFEADISRLKQLQIKGYSTSFEENIGCIVKTYMNRMGI